MDFELFLHKKNKQGPYAEYLVLPTQEIIEIRFLGITNSFIQTAMSYDLFKEVENLYFEYLKTTEKCPEADVISSDILKDMVSRTYTKIAPQLTEKTGSFEVGYPNINSEVYIWAFGDSFLHDIESHPLGDYLKEVCLLNFAVCEWLRAPHSEKKESPFERFAEIYNYLDYYLDIPINRSPVKPIFFLSEVVSSAPENKEYFLMLKSLYLVKYLRESTLSQSITAFNLEKKISRTRRTYSKKQYEPDKETKETIYRHVPSKWYSSNQGLLPLAWAEILYCLENNLTVKECIECGKLFHSVKGTKLCSTACKKKRKARQDKNR